MTARMAVPAVVALAAAGCGATAAPRHGAPLSAAPKTVTARRLHAAAAGGLKRGPA